MTGKQSWTGENVGEEWVLASALESVERAEGLAVRYAGLAGFDADTAETVGMVAREAAVNAVVHGNRFAADKRVRVRCECEGETLRIVVADEGDGLDAAAVPDPLAPENLLRSSGRGIFLMRSFMDSVEFRDLGPGTEVTLSKRYVVLRRDEAETHLIDSEQRRKTMSMKVKTRSVDGVSILDLSGRITMGDGTVTLRDAVKDAVSKGNLKVLLNLADVDYIDSSGIGELVSAYTSVKNAGGELKLLHLTKKVHDLLQITKLYTVFDVKDDEGVAVGSFMG